MAMNLPKKELYAGMLPLLDRGEGAMYVLEVTTLPPAPYDIYPTFLPIFLPLPPTPPFLPPSYPPSSPPSLLTPLPLPHPSYPPPSQ